ncbi:family 1 encapsulin nanocompartment shell protein [Tepidimicrobium xylanilyticum]|uniref:Type 1 encapsulin shell protein n=1 Tax=Tepidimicrobium xylanilyticum TaxID=1123352 RepID=A0A1H2SSE3_9FIRM|nr:family 1 encapsulin nanocompartment shell protein [Tepidimicrobium xylanilyticum]GMG96135.1 bacteriocin [Tepidimicrobium xylanilyticum]SDW34447.1 Uncharacterized protein, linocin/CFP29 family [Tepidimicrobium xylanilyticum]
MLHRDKAPITNDSWKEIEERLMEVFKTYLSARKVFRVEGPKGWNYNVITEGRLGEIKEDGDLCYANYQVLPLTEVRVEFEMDRWELDNIVRGAKDVDYGSLEEAGRRIALFEENAIYNGLENAHIKGVVESSTWKALDFGKNSKDIMESISKGLIMLKEAYQEGPFSLVVGEEAYKRILSSETSYPFDKRIEELIGHKIVYSHVIDGAILVPFNHEDLELTIGQDLSIGYQGHDTKKVRFFITESFTFRILDPSLIVNYKL